MSTWNWSAERRTSIGDVANQPLEYVAERLLESRKRAFDAELKAQQLQTELDALKAAHAWINTSERMPRAHESVLGVDGQGDVSEVRHFVNDIWSYADSNRQVDGPITYWMPLPELPK